LYADPYSIFYNKSYCRAAPYLIGLMVAYVFKIEGGGKARAARLRPLTLRLGWLVSATLLFLIAFCMPGDRLQIIPAELPQWADSAVLTFTPLLWSLAVAFMVYICAVGQGGILNQLLSARVWVPLSRLTYACYLLHPFVLEVFFSSLLPPLNFSEYQFNYFLLGTLVVSYGCASLLFLSIEVPFAMLEQLFFSAR
jgi:peptidoglycan/LPS O-acetylase OafA/YrhL